jgi:hypothetical protein
MAITATNMAQLYYNNYEFSSTQAGSGQASAEASQAESEYGISDLSSALSSLSDPANVYSITNLDTYVKDTFMLSQSAENGTLTSLTDSSWDNTSDLDQSIAESVMENKLGLSDSSGVNLNGLLTADGSAEASQEMSKLDAATDPTSDYEDYLNGNNGLGSLFDGNG